MKVNSSATRGAHLPAPEGAGAKKKVYRRLGSADCLQNGCYVSFCCPPCTCDWWKVWDAFPKLDSYAWRRAAYHLVPTPALAKFQLSRAKLTATDTNALIADYD
jgi:hypothetical protein